jgi:dihydrofolate synthase/folylpolyglutamate synthase
MRSEGRTYAVFSMLNDKDIPGVISAVRSQIDEWFVSGLAGPRGSDASALSEELTRAGVLEPLSTHETIAAAYAQACDRAAENDRIVVFGSFYTVAAVMAARELMRRAR